MDIAFVLAAAGFLNGLTQVALYSVRVAHVQSFNRIKLVWSVVTTILFLGLLPFSWLWLPVIYLIGSVIVLAGINRVVYMTRLKAAYEADLSHHIRGCFIFGAQALMLNLPQHGIRLIIAAFMTVETVAQFTIAQQSTAVFFVYSAVMITGEANSLGQHL